MRTVRPFAVSYRPQILMRASGIALVTGQLSREINEVALEMEKIFGSINEHSLKLR